MTKAKPAKQLYDPDSPENAFGVAEAKARFSEVVERARTLGPQRIQYRGKPAAVVVSAEMWERMRPKESLLEFFRQCPLWGSGIEFERVRDYPRPIEL